MAWVRGTDKIFFTEKNTGRIRVMNGKNLLGTPCADLNVASSGERGLLGIALHPNFKDNKFLYVYWTQASPLQNKVTRFKVVSNRCRKSKTIVGGINASSSGYHNGGQIEFIGKKLYVATGEAHSASAAQDRNNKLGKVLRLTASGRVPDGNPFNNAVWSYGHRNPFGLARKPGTKKLWETENGPNCDDELNIIKKGRNYGWGGGYNCGTAGVGPNPKPPEVRWSNVIVPTDLGWYHGKLKGIRGLLGGDYTQGRIHHFVLNDKGTDVKRDHVIYNGSDAIIDVAEGPGKWLYFLTTNAIKRVVKK
jgi:glucose/arabinose dehydrogenase